MFQEHQRSEYSGIQVVSAAILDHVQMNMDSTEAATQMQVARIARPAQNTEEKVVSVFNSLLEHMASFAIVIHNEEYVPFKVSEGSRLTCKND